MAIAASNSANSWSATATPRRPLAAPGAALEQVGRETVALMPISALAALCRVPDYAE